MSTKPHVAGPGGKPLDSVRPTTATQTIWLEAERFEELGGWKNDPQFLESVGSPYLLAAGVGRPVADAVTTFSVSRAGAYRLWVRCKDWFPSHSPGRFQVLVDGVSAPVLFGEADNDRWQWIDGSTFQLSAGDHEIRLHDLTGWWGRCDAIVLTSDDKFAPSDDGLLLEEQRAQFGGHASVPQEVGYYDVVVVGGGIAGSLAAIAAAREGAEVALVQDRPVLGGNGSTEIQVPVMGDLTYEPWDPRETGLLEEVVPSGAGHGPWSSRLEELIRAESRIRLWLNTRLTQVEMESAGQIAAIEAIDTVSGERMRLRGGVFVDCTGDAWLGYQAGADFRHGHESRSEYNEPAAPEHPDGRTQGSSLNAGRFTAHDKPISFVCPGWAYRWESPEDFDQRSQGAVWNNGFRVAEFNDVSTGKGRHPQNFSAPVREWYVEFGGNHDTIADAEWIRDELFRINVGVWDYIKNHHPEYRDLNKNRELVWLNYVVGKRESRRLMGDYVVTQNDFINKSTFPDTVAYAGWVMDVHHPGGFFSPGPQAHLEHLGRAPIPFRSLYSRNVHNLMMAGRNISVSHLGLAKTRVMRTCGLLGWAAGVGAAMASLQNITPAEVGREHIQALQQRLLRDGGYLPGVANEDPTDLARSASVTASSTAIVTDPEYLVTLPHYYWKSKHPLSTGLATQFRAPEDRIESVSLYLRSERDTPVTMPLRLYSARWEGDLQCTDQVTETSAELPAGFEGWLEFPLNSAVQSGSWYVMTLPKTDDAFWDLYTYHPPDTWRGYETPPAWSCEWGCHKFSLNPGGEPPASKFVQQHGMHIPFSAENVLNGISRATDGAPNSWAPDPTASLPQWLEFDFGQEVSFNTVCLYFQMRMLAPSDYSLQVDTPSGWQTVVRREGNEHRRTTERFERTTTSRLRVVLEKRSRFSEVPLTPICEVRVYDEKASPEQDLS